MERKVQKMGDFFHKIWYMSYYDFFNCKNKLLSLAIALTYDSMHVVIIMITIKIIITAGGSEGKKASD